MEYFTDKEHWKDRADGYAIVAISERIPVEMEHNFACACCRGTCNEYVSMLVTCYETYSLLQSKLCLQCACERVRTYEELDDRETLELTICSEEGDVENDRNDDDYGLARHSSQ